jgi:putative endonuclease
MSHSTNAIGQSGEAIASTHLASLGFKILETNWRHGHDEVDIISENEQFIVFVEVKTRHSNTYGRPEEFVTRQKQRFMIRAANAYITKNDIDKEARFDIVAVTLQQGSHEVVHITDAFYPTL